MAKEISDEMYNDMAVMFLNYLSICKHFGVTQEQMREFGTGDKIVKEIQNLQTYMLISKARENKTDV